MRSVVRSVLWPLEAAFLIARRDLGEENQESLEGIN